MHECEVVEVLERLDVHLRQGLQFLCREHAVAIGVEALHRHCGVELVEGPGVANARDLVIGIENYFRAHADPDMRVRGGRRSAKESDGRAKTAKMTIGSQGLVLRVKSAVLGDT